MKIGAMCRAMTISDVARHMRLDWHRVKELDKIYMREQLARTGSPKPNVIGVDEISIRKGHNCIWAMRSIKFASRNMPD